MKTLIAALVGMVILFVYQGLSWMVLPIHKNAFSYNKDQDAVMANLSQHLNEDGIYYMPTTPPDVSMHDHQDFMKNSLGKPWAIINYHKSMSSEMGMQMIFGLLFNLLCVLLVVLVLSSARVVFATFGSRLAVVMAFSLFLVIGGPLMSWNWWSYPSSYVTADVIDIIVGWLLCGLWLSWYLGKSKKKHAE